jgi:formate hydrogenlyase subunit 3/multisubunit Na+/H+ antiporter MnhD subunit
MSAPLIWIVLPGVMALLLFLLRQRQVLVIWAGILLSLWLLVMAITLPVEEVITFGQRTFKLSESLAILGREFILTDTDRPFLAMLFFFQMGWVFGALFVRPVDLFVPITFAMGALLNAALAVEPFLYAALLIEISALIAIPMLCPPGQKPGRGIFRFLAFQTFGMPFILLAGHFLTGLEASPGQTEVVTQSGVLLGIGFAFILAMVPFHSWVPMLTEESKPYPTAYVLFILTGMVSLFGLGFFDRFVWLRDSDIAYLLLRYVGALMLLVGGTWAALERNWGRMLGYYLIAETGVSLLAIGINSPQGVLVYFWLLLVRYFSLVIWAGALSIIKKRTKNRLDMDALSGFGHKRPLLLGIALIAQVSLIGAPFLAGYSARFALWQHLAGTDVVAAGIALLGNIGLLAGALQVLGVLFVPFRAEEDAQERRSLVDILSASGSLVSERLFNWLLLGVIIVLLVGVGTFPRFYLPWLEKLLLMFNQIGS